MDRYGELGNLIRKRLAYIWKVHKMCGSLKEEDEKLATIMEEHKEYHKVWEIADKIVDNEYTVEGVNPFLHIHIHLIIEDQLVMGQPKVVKEVVDELNKLGFPHHEIVHMIGIPLIEQIFNILKNNALFNEKKYAEDLRKIVENAKKNK